MKKHILYLMISTAVFVANSAFAMDKAIQEEHKAPQIHLSISPEQMKAINAMHAVEALYPQIARKIPLITSKEEFEVAKQYADLTKKYYALLFAGAAYGPTGNNIKMSLLQEADRVLKGLETYVQTLQGPSCNAFRSQEDQKAFEREMYDIHYKIAKHHLMLLIKAVLIPENDLSVMAAHVQEIKKIQEQLSGNAEHRKKLQEEISKVEEMIPTIRFLFHPQTQGKPSHPGKQQSKRIKQQRTVNHYQKLANGTPNNLFQDVESFDAYFSVTSTNILTEHLALFAKKIPHEAFIGCVQKLTDDCVSLEKRGEKFKTFLLGTTQPSQSDLLTSEELADLYKFFCKRHNLPNKSPLQFLEVSIFMFIQANKVEEALKRTEALGTILLQNGLLSERFISLRASVMALNGDSEEWKKLIENKRNTAQKEKADTEQKKVNQIKKQQEKVRKAQEEIEALKQTPQPIPIKKKIEEPVHMTDPFEDTPVFSRAEAKPERIAPREKIKTRKAPQEPANDQGISPKSLTLETEETPKVRKEYTLSKNAFKTYQKIRKGDWKFPRSDLYNLFDKLGCKVDIEQGKGDHGTIPLPLIMTIHGTEGVVAVLPEFTQSQPENRPPRPLTIPNWDEKWDGRVPPYMKKSILRALDYLDATDETVHK